MKVVCISGKALAGKDSIATSLSRQLSEKGKRVLIYHHADYLKYLCKQYFGWDGVKDEKGRTILQHIGTDIVRTKKPTFWVDTAIDFLKMFKENYDYVLIADCRFVNEVESYKPIFPTTSLRIHRPDFDNGLTQEQKSHASETALDDYSFDITINCPSGLNNIDSYAKMLIEEGLV